MNHVVVLNGFDFEDPLGDALCDEVQRKLIAQGNQSDDIRIFHLAAFDIGRCLGEFDCWAKTPGRCRIHDEGQEIERAMHDAQLLVFLTPVRYGAFSVHLKKAVDRLIPLISPFFVKRHDLTHHQKRYAQLPSMAAVGVDTSGRPEQAALFRALVESNALNLHSPSWAATLLGTDARDWPAKIEAVLAPCKAPGNATGTMEQTQQYLRKVIQPETLPQGVYSAPAPAVVLLTASGRAPGVSTSESILRYLGYALSTGGADVKHVNASSFLRDTATIHATATECAAADVLILASPLYVDNLSYPAQLALEHIQAARARMAPVPPSRFVVAVNCGFPEPEHVRFALATAREFAIEAGYVYAGGLAVGGGEVIHGQALGDVGGVIRHLRHGLDTVATALLAGQCVPAEVCEEIARPFLPAAVYRIMGGWGWRIRQLSHGFPTHSLHARPFDKIDDAEWERLAATGPVRARPLRVIGRVVETADAVTLLLEDPARHIEHLQAGQYLTLELPIDGERVRRAYSVSSAPCEAGLSITVKRVPGGRASNWIHDHLPVDSLLRAFGPAGHFTPAPIPADGARHLLLIAGGSGVVPLAAIATQVLATEPGSRVSMIHGSAALERTIFAARLNRLADQHRERFSLHYVFETPPPDWVGATGRLDPDILRPLLQGIDLTSVQQVMLSGPDGMRVSVRRTLDEQGFDKERVLEESFVSPRRSAVPDVAQQAEFTGSDSSTKVQVAVGHTLLEAALDAGVPIGFSCCSGGCGACRVHITEGLSNVVLDEPNEISNADQARGCVPACLVRLKGPCRFELNH